MDIIFNSIDIKVEEITKEYIRQKISKLEQLLDGHLQITVFVKGSKLDSNKPDIKLEVNVNMPRAFIKVVEEGTNINEICDKLVPVLARRLKRYQGRFADWHKQNHWKTKEITLEEEAVAGELDDTAGYLDYQPEIKYKRYEDDSPLHPAEAIEKMILLGHKSFLFKNIESGKYAMIYTRAKGGYGIVEPAS